MTRPPQMRYYAERHTHHTAVYCHHTATSHSSPACLCATAAVASFAIARPHSRAPLYFLPFPQLGFFAEKACRSWSCLYAQLSL